MRVSGKRGDNPAGIANADSIIGDIIAKDVDGEALATLVVNNIRCIAQQLGADADAFLMAFAVGASCAFLTHIGHKNNTLILGPGGFCFSGYWRLDLAREAIVIVVSVPVILRVWPL